MAGRKHVSSVLAVGMPSLPDPAMSGGVFSSPVSLGGVIGSLRNVFVPSQTFLTSSSTVVNQGVEELGQITDPYASISVTPTGYAVKGMRV